MISPPRHSTVVAYLALVTALGTGGAYAAGQVGAHDIKKDAVRSKHIKDGQVRNQDLAGDAVTGDKVAANTLTGSDISESTLGQVPNAATLAGRLPATFATSTVYKKESALGPGTRLGDNSNVLGETCDPGDILLSGGPANVSATSDMVESFPSPGVTNGWSARIFDNGAADNFSVVVLCLDQTP